jgi:type II secretory pathway pseudopilin PulG
MHISSKRRAAGFSLIELLVVVSIIMIIMGMAIPRLQATKVQAFEAGAMKAISTLHVAQAQYQSQNGRFANTMAELGPPLSGGATASAGDLIGADLASGEKGGYRYTIQATEAGYTIHASPTAFNTTGKHTYYSDQSLVIRQNASMGPATAASPEINPR